MKAVHEREEWLPGWELRWKRPIFLFEFMFTWLCGGMIALGRELFDLGALPDFKGPESAELMQNPVLKKLHGDGTSGNFACRYWFLFGWIIVTVRGSDKSRLGKRSFVFAKADWKLRKVYVRAITIFGDGSSGATINPQPSTDFLLVAAAFKASKRLKVWAHPHVPSGLSEDDPLVCRIALHYPSKDAKDFKALSFAVSVALIIDLVDHDPRKVPNGEVDSMIVLGENFVEVREIILSLIRNTACAH